MKTATDEKKLATCRQALGEEVERSEALAEELQRLGGAAMDLVAVLLGGGTERDIAQAARRLAKALGDPTEHEGHCPQRWMTGPCHCEDVPEHKGQVGQ